VTTSGLRLAAGGALAAALLAGCGGKVPEQALRDEQARTRHYRDAYETAAAELAAAKARVAELEQRCAASKR
jgi:hypothetical protein